jgi:hypothetical protein
VPQKASLLVKEKQAGNERLAVALKGFRSGVLRQQFGDPVDGSTAYRVCIYDGDDALVADLVVDRAGVACVSKPCWKAVSSKGWKYRDTTASADGIHGIVAKSGSGKAKLIIKGRNRSRKGQSSLPSGIASALTGSSRASVRVLTSDADCFAGNLGRVKKDTGSLFKAFGP